jgi:c-di-GMP-binding flagellar brake protein YcgR
MVGGGLLLVFFNSGKGKTQTWLEFYAKGKDAGFSVKEIELLRRLAVKSNMEDPISLYYSQTQMDLCIRSLVKNMHLAGDQGVQKGQDFLSKLYDYRKKIEMNKPKIKHGIFNSRQITEGQNLRILIKGTGVFKSQVIKCTNQSLMVSRPITNEEPGSFSWAGQQISVYFWRDDDAGYVFDTSVMDEVISQGLPSLKIAHSDSLFRTQKRKSIRVKIHKPAFLYHLVNDDDAYMLELSPGLKCHLEDISDTGCAITVLGKAVANLRIKAQFLLNNNPVVMAGTVRSVEYKEDINRSLLHIEADSLPIETRNVILGEVFGMLPEDEDDLPFRVLNEEAEAMVEVQGQEPSEENLETALAEE